MAAEDAHGSIGANVVSLPAAGSSSRTEGSNLETYERVVNLKLKNFLLDFCRTRAFECAICDQRRDRLDVRSGWTIVGERWHDLAYARVHTA